MVLGLADVSGIGCSTSQCSTILPALVEAKDVDAGPVAVAGPVLIAVQHDEVALGNDPPELDPFARILTRHPLEVLDERRLAVGDHRIVLRVGGPRVARDRF